ncbi:MAG: hypothetical protein K2Q06_06080, partial [Parvularculaceae bacterium]|nr:hypothetical protein [Parvularculaceae bacterium]
MASLMQAVRQLAAEIVLRDKTGEGAASAAGNFEKVGDAAEGAARVVEKTSTVTSSAERAYQR